MCGETSRTEAVTETNLLVINTNCNYRASYKRQNRIVTCHPKAWALFHMDLTVEKCLIVMLKQIDV